MNKLKTLKDMFWGENINSCLCGSCDQGFGCDIERIRKESINWIKSYRSWDKTLNGNVGEDIAIQFMLFFNITEGDLNNE